jgi:hypothetical protein
MTVEKTSEVQPGEVKVQFHPEVVGGKRWYLIEIGRSRYVKRFNVSEDEAAQIVAQLARLTS